MVEPYIRRSVMDLIRQNSLDCPDPGITFLLSVVPQDIMDEIQRPEFAPGQVWQYLDWTYITFLSRDGLWIHEQGICYCQRISEWEYEPKYLKYIGTV